MQNDTHIIGSSKDDHDPFMGMGAVVAFVLDQEDQRDLGKFWEREDERKRAWIAAGFTESHWSGEAVAAGAGGSAAAPPLSSYLENKRETVTEGVDRNERIEVRKCGCKSFFCPNCCISMGIKLKRRLLGRLDQFKSLMMLTFTVDPQLFATPQDALEYVQQHRCISVAMQNLRRAKCVHSGRYFCVIEWQENGWPHWHVLVDASFIPFDDLCNAWNRSYHDWQARVAAGRPGFGGVKFSMPKFNSKEHAAGYVCGYLTKYPKPGYPKWVTDQSTRSVHRYQTSRGFWKDGQEDDGVEDGKDDSGVDSETSGDDQPDEADKPQKQRTIADQIAACGQRCTIFRVHDELNHDTGEIEPVFEFVGSLEMPLEAVRVLEPDEVNKPGSCLTFKDKARFWRELRARKLFAGGEKICRMR